MRRRIVGSLIAATSIAAGTWLASAPTVGHAQTAGAAPWTQTRTPWGDPDMRGIWTSMGVAGVPIQRPASFGTRQFLTDEEFAERQEQGQRSQERSNRGQAGWWEWYGRESRMTSLITAPPNGQIPWRPEALEEFAAAVQVRRELKSYVDLDMWERCLTRGLPSAMMPGPYNASYRIMQVPGYVVIKHEMFDMQFIPLDGRPSLDSNIQQYFGSARGRWEENTLVVETTNFAANTRGTLKADGGSPSFGRTAFTGTGASLRVVERFTRVDADTVTYEGTVHDETAFTGPWTVTIPLRRDDDYEVFEYACHEGNYFMTNLLSVQRFGERNPKPTPGNNP